MEEKNYSIFSIDFDCLLCFFSLSSICVFSKFVHSSAIYWKTLNLGWYCSKCTGFSVSYPFPISWLFYPIQLCTVGFHAAVLCGVGVKKSDFFHLPVILGSVKCLQHIH